MLFRTIIRSAVVVVAILVSGTCAFATSNKITHLLAMGGCPPWKVIEGDAKATQQMAESCQKDVEAIVAGLKKALSLKDEHITTRIDEEATAHGVREALRALDTRAKAEDRVVIYFNFHGGNIDANYNGYDIQDEVLAMYTAEEPKDFKAASIRGDWMPMKSIRDLVNEIDAEEIILIFEVCEVAAGYKNFRYNMSRRAQKDWKGREAVIFTSRGDQSAAFNEEGTMALFTDIFSKGLKSATGGNLRDIFEEAALDVNRSRRAVCMKEENLETFYDNEVVYLHACTQLPLVYDPYGLMDDIYFGGSTMISRWHELKDRRRASTNTATTTTEDPFAWAQNFIRPRAQAQPQSPMMPVGPYSSY